MLAMADELGFALSLAKCTPQTHSLDWLRYLVCTKITIIIPAEKLNEIIHECEARREGGKASRRDLQMFVGFLQTPLSTITRSTQRASESGH